MTYQKTPPAFDVAEVLERAKNFLNFRTDAQLAEYLGISRSTLSNWAARNSMDYPLVLGRLKQVDYNWLLTGEPLPAAEPPVAHLTPMSEAEYVETGSVHGLMREVNTHLARGRHATRRIPLYSTRVAANLDNGLSPDTAYTEEMLEIPNAPDCDAAVIIEGQSMEPDFRAGDIVAFKLLDDPSDWNMDQIYVIWLRDGDESKLTLKMMNRGTEPGCVLLESLNKDPRFYSRNVAKEDILKIGRVKLTISMRGR